MGRNPRRLATEIVAKSTRGWSRDNRRIVYAAGREENTAIYVVDVASAASSRLTTSRGEHRDPAWSPDDAHVVFSSTRDGGSHIYVTSAEGRKGRQLTSGQASDVSPRWSPDGNAIVFGSDRDGTRDLYVIQVKDGRLERLTTGARVTRDPPLWSPDGSSIAFQIADGENYQVGVVRLSDRSRSLLASSSAYDGSYAWAPDGKRVAFISGRDGFDGLFTVDADGQQPGSPHGDTFAHTRVGIAAMKDSRVTAARADWTKRVRLISAAVLAAASACDGAPATESQVKPAGSPPLLAARTDTAPCAFRENGFRQGPIAPQRVHFEPPDLSGLPPLASDRVVIVEMRIDAAGKVTESCVLRGVREDVDLRAIAAVQKWVFEPPRLRSSVDGPGGHFDAGTAVPVIMTATVQLGARAGTGK